MSSKLAPTADEMKVYQVMATSAAKSKFFEKLGGEAGILSIMLMARELGICPMTAIMGGMNVIQGKVEISPRLMNTMIRKAGHKIQILESTNETCVLRGVRGDTKEDYTASFSMQDAVKAGLVKGGGAWDKFPSDMLFARCISKLARRLFADVISTSYVDKEIEEEVYVQPSKQIALMIPTEVETVEEEPYDEKAKKLSVGQVKTLESLVLDDEDLKAKILTGYKVESFHDLLDSCYPALIRKILKMKSIAS